MPARKTHSAVASASHAAPVVAPVPSPAAPGMVLQRERLHALIDARLPGAVWLHGPTGAGKTVLLRTYLQLRQCVSLWLSVDERHRDPAALFAALSTAAEPHCAGPLPAFSPEHRDDPAAFGHDYFTRLDHLLATDVAIVVDDLHHLVGSTAPLFAAAIDRFGGRRRLCFASQLMPDASFAPQLAGSRLWIVGHKALAFDVDEARGLADRIGASATTLDALVDATDGWAAGLMLAMQFGASGGSDGGSTDPLETVRTPLAMLIAGQVLGGVPADDVARLRLLAELPQVPMELADVAPEWASACARLQGLAERGLFVERLVSDRARSRAPTGTDPQKLTRLTKGCWRLHDLFRSALREPSGSEVRAGERVGSLVASLLQVDRLDLAWQLAAQVDRRLFESLVVDHGHEALAHHQVLSLLQLARPHADRASPPVAIWAARAMIGNDNTASLQACDEAYAGFDATGDADGLALATSLALFVIFATIENVGEMAIWIERFAEVPLPSIDEHGNAPHCAIRIAGEVVHELLIGGRLGGPTAHCGLQDRLLDQVSAQVLSANESVLAGSLLVAAMNRATRGHEVELAVLLVEALDSFGRAAPHIRTSWNIENGFHFTRLGDGARARSCFQDALRVADENALVQSRIYALIGLARLELGLGREDSAGLIVAALDAMEPSKLGRHRGWVIHLRARLDALAGRAAVALQRIDLAERFITEAGFPPSTTVILDQDRIQVLYAQGQLTTSLALARDVVQRSSIGDSRRIETVAGLIEAHALWDADQATAMALLTKSLASARSLNLMTFLSLLPEVAAQVAARGLRHGIEEEFLVKVIKMRGLSAPRDAPAGWPWPVRVEVLAPFRIMRNGTPLSFTGKAQQKPLELLKYLVCTKDFLIDVSSLAASLWTDSEEAAAKKSLEVTISRLRKLLEDDSLVIVKEGKVSLDDRRVTSDAKEFFDAARDAEALVSRKQSRDEVDAIGKRLLVLFREMPLEHEESGAWREAVRERFRAAFLRASRAVIAYWTDRGETVRAQEMIEAALSREPLAEHLYRLLMQIHLAAGQHNEAMRVYRQCRQMLSVLIGSQPSVETERLRSTIQL